MLQNPAKFDVGRALRTLACLIGVLFLYTLIFSMSAQDGETSGGLSGKLTALLIPAGSPAFDVGETVIRKLAHMTEFALLCLFWNGTLLFGLPAWNPAARDRLTLGLCAVSACADEIHQLFVPGRSGQVTDVLIDIAGAALMLCLILLVRRMRNRRGQTLDEG